MRVGKRVALNNTLHPAVVPVHYNISFNEIFHSHKTCLFAGKLFEIRPNSRNEPNVSCVAGFSLQVR